MTTTNPSSGSSAPKGSPQTLTRDKFDIYYLAPTVSSAHAIARAAYPKEIEAIDALVQKFEAFSDHHLVAAEAHPASYVGDTGLLEVVVGALARDVREQRKAERSRERERKDWWWSLFKDIVLLVVGGILALGLKALFFPPSAP